MQPKQRLLRVHTGLYVLSREKFQISSVTNKILTINYTRLICWFWLVLFILMSVRFIYEPIISSFLSIGIQTGIPKRRLWSRLVYWNTFSRLFSNTKCKQWMNLDNSTIVIFSYFLLRIFFYFNQREVAL